MKIIKQDSIACDKEKLNIFNDLDPINNRKYIPFFCDKPCCPYYCIGQFNEIFCSKFRDKKEEENNGKKDNK